MYQSLIHYYVALKLSAAAVAPMFGPELDHQPVPIVRKSIMSGETQWDPREIVSVGGETGVVTLPHGAHRGPIVSLIGNNQGLVKSSRPRGR